MYFVILLTLYILILCTNGTIICLIWIHRNLHEPMYIFIAALSLNSLLFSTVIYPKLFIDVLSQKQIISHSTLSNYHGKKNCYCALDCGLVFTCIFFDVIITSLDSHHPKHLRFIITLQILVYNPLFNPIIYGVKMKEIWKYIQRLFYQLVNKRI
ncbi:olfactory receptor 8A1-like [Entelurus aequoreus]|uniref:olfactory receptor 8A1-like n=1 Tax=Entelurus aequoreus TaxID=161455 RepID=UPI002B1D00FC|nr:olfactory receptor 8A1-like [Entelurus aequoreus]